VCRSASGSVQPPPVCTSGRCVHDSSLAYQAVRLSCQQAVIRLIGLVILTQRVTFKLCLTSYKCLHGLAPPYLTRFCTPLSAVAGRTHLRSADQHKLFVPRTSTSTFGSRAFSSSSPLSRNALPRSFVTQPSPSTSSDNPCTVCPQRCGSSGVSASPL